MEWPARSGFDQVEQGPLQAEATVVRVAEEGNEDASFIGVDRSLKLRQ
jgi:hypothetical protein